MLDAKQLVDKLQRDITAEKNETFVMAGNGLNTFTVNVTARRPVKRGDEAVCIWTRGRYRLRFVRNDVNLQGSVDHHRKMKPSCAIFVLRGLIYGACREIRDNVDLKAASWRVNSN
jgi:hypothetical protein